MSRARTQRHIAPAAILLLVAALALFASRQARAQRFGGGPSEPRVEVSVDSRAIYAGLPFDLLVSAEGFDEQPQPEVTPFEIPGCTVEFIGVNPNVATSVMIVNGQRTESRRVEFVYRYRVETTEAGEYQLPAITVTQGPKKAATRPARFEAIAVPTTRDMRIQLTLPQRPVSVGETFDVTVDWYLRRENRGQNFVVPLFDAQDWVEVHGQTAKRQPRPRRQQTETFRAGDREIELPFTADAARLDGVQYKRYRFTAQVTPIKAGTLEIAPTRVVASLQVGGSGFFARTRLYKAQDMARSLQIKPLPVKDRPPSFAGAVGTAFSMQVHASRTVVKLGEPIELDILIRGDGRLEGLSLPKLDASGSHAGANAGTVGLSPDKFAIADTLATGELIRNGPNGDVKGKRFHVTVRIKSPDVSEIPRLAFSYFNPKSGTYDTVHSQPIALSVAGSAIVGAADVVSGAKKSAGQSGVATADVASGKSGQSSTSPGGSDVSGSDVGDGSFAGVDLSLSHGGSTLAAAWSVAEILPAVLALYAVPLLLLGFVWWRARTRLRRDQSSGAKRAMKAVTRAIDRAASDPARDAAPDLLAALRQLATATGRESSRGEAVIARIETESYNPKAANSPLPAEVLDDARTLAKSWLDDSRHTAGNKNRTGGSKSRGVAAVILIAAASTAGWTVHAESADPATALEAARDAYQTALNQQERDARAAAFARAERMFRQLVESSPDRPELLTDWGNAALGAQDLGRATLAYRRALELDPGHSRAERNLSWVRSRMPSWLPRPKNERAFDSLFFWHHGLSVPTRHLLAAVAFAGAVFLLVPWGRRRVWLRRLAFFPAVIWLALLTSLVLDQPPVADAVVITDGVALRSADSPGAASKLRDPLPAGTEVTVVESRDLWVRVSLANGDDGWLQNSAIEHVLSH